MTVRKGLGQANILRTNNNTSTGYGIVYADEVSGHRTVGNLTALYALNDWQLSASGDNTGSDAVGQLWYVVDADGNGNGCYYQLKDWSKRKEAAGWSEFKGTGASTAAAVTFDNTASGMTAANAQGAIEELNVKKLDKPEVGGTKGQVLSLDENGNTIWKNEEGGGALGGFKYADSIDQIPSTPPVSEQNIGYVVGTHFYVFVATGGDVKDGKWKDVGEFRGPKGEQGPQGNTGSSVAYPFELVNNLTDGGAEKALSAQMGKELNEKISGSKGDYIEVDIMDEVLSNYLNAYLEKNGVVTSDINWKITQPILLKKDEYILIDTKAGNYPQIAKASENPIKVGDTLTPLSLVGNKYLATEDVWVVFSGAWSDGCYVKKGFQERIEGIKDRVESLEGKVPLLEELRTDMYSTTIIKDISITLYDNAILGYIQDDIIKSDTSWKVSQPFYVKKGTRIKIIGGVGLSNTYGSLAKVSKSTISVGDSVETLATGKNVEFTFSEDMFVVVAFGKERGEVIINYTEGNDVKGKSEQGVSAYDALVGQSSLLREVPYLHEYFRINAYIDSNGAIVEYNGYFISKPIELKKGETIIAIISGLEISGLSLYVSPGIYQPLIPLNGVNQNCVYTSEEDCRVAISAQISNDVTIKIKKFVVTGDILSRIEKLEKTDLKINKAFLDSWKDNMLIQYSKLLEVMENKPTSVIPIFVSSDTHGNGVEQHRIIHNLDKDGIEINNIFLGDNTPYSSVPIKDYNLEMRERIKDCKNFIAVVGNHDFVHSEKSENNYYNLNYCYLSTLRIRKCKSKDGSYVAYDDRRGVKFVVINNIAFTTEVQPMYKFGDMVDWLIDELSANDGYDVVILKHWMDYRVFESRTGVHTLSPADNYAAFFDARKNKTSGTFNDSTGGAHVYDFSNCKQDLLCVLHGHEHIELKYSEVGHVTTYCGHNFNSGNYDCMFGAIDREDNVLRVYRWNTIEAFDEWVIPLN